MAETTPDHRAGFAARSGDTHVIGEDGELKNVDQAARAAAEAEAAKASRRAQPTAPRDAAKADETPAA